MDDYNRIKNYLYSHNWHLELEEFYNLVNKDERTHKIGYKLNTGEGSETDTYFSIHFYMIDTDLYGDVWIRKYKQ